MMHCFDISTMIPICSVPRYRQNFIFLSKQNLIGVGTRSTMYPLQICIEAQRDFSEYYLIVSYKRTEGTTTYVFAPIEGLRLPALYRDEDAFIVPCDRCGYTMRLPARGRAPAQDTSRALPAERQTDTSHDSIQQSEKRLCFGIELPDADVLPSNPSRWRNSSTKSRVGWALIC
jgi:hypothetical protein